ncbi:MAG TPA: PLP-dependent aminotransferase family protein [Candidatus Acidoferrales bacterium]|nr:PLP-dependent aminotransferase family protein [Candidatus Acidoferrales bacterium]
MKSSALSALGRRTAPPPISWLMQAALSRPKLISLAAGFTDNATLPVEISRQVLNRVLCPPQTGRPALQYGITAGETNLRRLTARHLHRLDQSSPSSSSSPENKSRAKTKDEDDKCHSPSRVLITGGSQQLLYMTVEALCDEGDIVLVEDPTYFVFLSILQSRGLDARGIRLERDGLNLAHLKAVLQGLKKSGELRRVKALYLVSYFQNPTGITTSFEKKCGALKLLKTFERAAAHPIYLIEDAAYRELRFHGRDIKSALMAPGAKERVIYAGTYSKPYAPGVRVGFGLLPQPLFTTVLHIKGNHDFGTANLLQQLLAGALETGLYRRHVAKIEERYGQKAQVMKQALAEHFPPDVEIWESGGGLYFWGRLPKHIATGVKSQVFRTALKNDVLYVPGELCYADDPARRKPDHEMRISFGSASEKNIREGIKRLGAVLRKFL